MKIITFVERTLKRVCCFFLLCFFSKQFIIIFIKIGINHGHLMQTPVRPSSAYSAVLTLRSGSESLLSEKRSKREWFTPKKPNHKKLRNNEFREMIDWFDFRKKRKKDWRDTKVAPLDDVVSKMKTRKSKREAAERDYQQLVLNSRRMMTLKHNTTSSVYRQKSQIHDRELISSTIRLLRLYPVQGYVSSLS